MGEPKFGTGVVMGHDFTSFLAEIDNSVFMSIPAKNASIFRLGPLTWGVYAPADFGTTNLPPELAPGEISRGGAKPVPGGYTPADGPAPFHGAPDNAT